MRRLFPVLALCLALPAFANEPVEAFPGGPTDADMLAARERLLNLAEPEEILMHAACCKMCSSGKACGDSCIGRDKQCRKGVGCACDG
jgi:hypothetical protein